MYQFFFKSCLVALGIGTVLGLAALWLPNIDRHLFEKLFWSDGILFVSALAGAVISRMGADG